MASGDRIQIVLEAKDEMTQQISKTQKSLKGLEAEAKQLADQVRAGNTEAADSYEAVRREIKQQEKSLADLKAEQKIVAREASKLAREEAEARVKAKLAAKQQTDAMQGVARVTQLQTNRIQAQSRQWDVLKMRVGHAASTFRSKWNAALHQVSSRMDRLRSKFGGLSPMVGAAVVGYGAVRLGTESVKEYAAAEEAQSKLTNAYAKFPKMARLPIESLREINTALMQNTKFDDDAAAAMQANLARFGLTGKQIGNLTPLVADLAEATGADLTTAGQNLGKSFLGNTRALKALGISYEMTGDKAKDMRNIVKLLNERVGGEAARAGDTAAGRWARLQNQFGEVKETIGSLLIPIFERLAPLALSVVTGIKDAFERNMPQIKRVLSGVGAVIERVFTFVRDNKEAFIAGAAAIGVMTLAMGALAIATNATGIPALIFAIGALVAGLVMAYKRVGWFRDAVDTAFRWIKQAVGWFVDWFKQYAWPIIHGYLKLWGMYLRNVVWPVVKFVWKAITVAVRAFAFYVSKVWWPAVRGIFRAFIAAGRWVWTGAKGAWDRVVGVFRGVKERIGDILGGIKDFFKNLWSGLTEGLPAAIQTMKDWLSKIPGLGALIDGFFFAGGPVAQSGRYMVGELGPEMFVPAHGSPYMVGVNGPEVRDLTGGGFVVPNHLVASVTLPPQRGAESAPAPVPGVQIGELHVHDRFDAEREMNKILDRQRRLAAERGA